MYEGEFERYLAATRDEANEEYEFEEEEAA